MPQTCTVCKHPKRREIDKAIVAGAALRDIAGRFDLTKSSVERHKADDLPQVLVEAAKEEDKRHAIDIYQQLKAINGACLSILKQAREEGANVTALQAVDRLHRQIELQARLLGDLDDRPQINILMSPVWITIRAALMDALHEFPSARAAVAQALQRFDQGAPN